jgi:hypothetical protein
MVNKTNPKTNQIGSDLLITRQELSQMCHCGVSSIDSSDTYASIPRVRIGRHTFFLRDDVMRFILAHREGGAE